MSSYHYCDYCTEPVYAGQGVVCWRLDGSEVVKHADVSVCEYNIRTDPDVVTWGLYWRDHVVGVREPEPRMSGIFERDPGSPSYLRGA